MITWPGKHVGVRPPEPGETPLSENEVMHGQNIELFANEKDEYDCWPIQRRYSPAGAWKIDTTRKATPWDALAV
jgi:hypothetical protein